jgi:hypothetical protein
MNLIYNQGDLMKKVHICAYGLSKNKIKKCYSKTLICTFIHLTKIMECIRRFFRKYKNIRLHIKYEIVYN